MADIYVLADRFRAAQLAREDAAVRRMALVWAALEVEVERQLLGLLQAAPEGRSPSALLLRDLAARLETVRALADQTARALAAETTALQADSAAAGAEEAEALTAARLQAAGATARRIGAALGRVPEEALAMLVGALGDGSPLPAVLARYGPKVESALQEALLVGLGRGDGPRQTARRMAEAIATGGPMPPGGPAELAEAMDALRYETERIARQETLRAYRGASVESYRANADVVEAWEWSCSRDRRTCPVCWAMDATIHPLEEPFASHVMCRCSPLPWMEGAPARRPGVEGFARLPDWWQRDVLGPRKYELYRAGEITLPDLVHEHVDGRWGPQRNEASIERARARAAAR